MVETNSAGQRSIRRSAYVIIGMIFFYSVLHILFANPKPSLDDAIERKSGVYLELAYFDSLLERRFTIDQINTGKNQAEEILDDQRVALHKQRQSLLGDLTDFYCSFLPKNKLPVDIAVFVSSGKGCRFNGAETNQRLSVSYAMADLPAILQHLHRYCGGSEQACLQAKACAEDCGANRKLIPIDPAKEGDRIALAGMLEKQILMEKKALDSARNVFLGLYSPLDFLWTNGMVFRWSEKQDFKFQSASFGWFLELAFWSLLGFLLKAQVSAISAFERGDYNPESINLTFSKAVIAPVVAVILVAFMLTGFTETHVKLWNGGLMLALGFALGFGSERALNLLRAAVDKLLPKVFAYKDSVADKALAQARFRRALMTPDKLEANPGLHSIEDVKRVAKERAKAAAEAPVFDAIAAKQS